MPQTRRMTRQHWPTEVFERAETLLSEGQTPPSAAAIARTLAEEFGDESRRDMPGERTVLGWIKKGVISRRTDLWSLATAQPGEAAAVLEAIAAVSARNRAARSVVGRVVEPPPVSADEAAVIARISEAAPGWDPVLRFEFGRFYAGWAAGGGSTRWLDTFLGSIALHKAWTVEGLKALEDAIANGTVEPISWQPSWTSAKALDLVGSIQAGLGRRTQT